MKRDLAALFWMSLACLALWVLRIASGGSDFFRFLPLNLVLAWVPVVYALGICAAWPTRRLLVVPLLALWLLFLPNAPYLATDLIHLRARAPTPLWQDAAMLVAFAFTGLFAAGVAGSHVLSKWPMLGASRVVVSALCGFGIALGRFAPRWNSWDLFTQPATLLRDIAGRFAAPMDNIDTWGITVCYGTLTWMALVAVGPRRAGPDRIATT